MSTMKAFISNLARDTERLFKNRSLLYDNARKEGEGATDRAEKQAWDDDDDDRQNDVGKKKKERKKEELKAFLSSAVLTGLLELLEEREGYTQLHTTSREKEEEGKSLGFFGPPSLTLLQVGKILSGGGEKVTGTSISCR